MPNFNDTYFSQRTVNSIVEFFRPPKEVNLAQLTSATLTKLEEFRDKTATGKNASITY